METIFGLENFSEAVDAQTTRKAARRRDKSCVAALGMFDGLHLGHQRVIGRTVEWAREAKAQSLIYTFDKHPRSLVGDAPPLFITSLKHKLMILEELGVDTCVVMAFDEQMMKQSARTFAERAFGCATGVVLGYDQRFGQNREGDLALLRAVGEERGFKVEVVEPVKLRGTIVSSTALRQAIVTGRLNLAAEMLGRRPSVLGSVVRGEGRGRVLGFPTANLDLGGEAHPPQGVYRTESIVLGKRWQSVTNIGRRPSFMMKDAAPDRAPVVETHLLDFRGDLLGEDMEVILHEKMRNEVRCRSEEELMRLIASDVEYVRSQIR